MKKGVTLVTKDRFDLESAIMEAWSSCEDIDLIYHNTDKLNLNAKDCDELQNQLLGLKYITELRFNKLWDVFEYMVHSGQFGGPSIKDKQGELFPELL